MPYSERVVEDVDSCDIRRITDRRTSIVMEVGLLVVRGRLNGNFGAHTIALDIKSFDDFYQTQYVVYSGAPLDAKVVLEMNCWRMVAKHALEVRKDFM